MNSFEEWFAEEYGCFGSLKEDCCRDGWEAYKNNLPDEEEIIDILLYDGDWIWDDEDLPKIEKLAKFIYERINL